MSEWGEQRWGSAGKSTSFLPAHCFFDLFGVSLSASCSLIVMLVVVSMLRVWVGLGLVVGGFVYVSVMTAEGLLQLGCGAWFSIGDSEEA